MFEEAENRQPGSATEVLVSVHPVGGGGDEAVGIKVAYQLASPMLLFLYSIAS